MLNSPVRGLLRPKTMQIGKGGFRRKKAIQPQSYTPSVVFGSDLITYYGNSVDELFADHRKAWEDSPELVTNGDFENADGWTLATEIQVVDGVLSFATSTTRAATTPSAQPLVAGRAYRVSLDVVRTSGSIEVFVGNTVSGAANSTGRHAFTIVTTAANQNIQVRSLGGGVFTIDKLSVKEIDPTKLRLYQDSAGATPVTAVEQFVGLVLDQSQGLSFGDWITGNGWYNAAASFDTFSATATGFVGTKTTAGGWDVGNSAVATVGPILSGEVYEVEIEIGAGTTVSSAEVGFGESINSRSDAASISVKPGVHRRYIRLNGTRPSCELSVRTGVLGVIEVVSMRARKLLGNHLSQPTATARPRLIQRTDLPGSPFVLRFDGTDDALRTGDINLTATTAISAIGTVQKNSDAALGTFFEFGPNVLANNGSFAVLTPPGSAFTGVGFQYKGDGSLRSINNDTFPAPLTAVLSLHANIAGPRIEGFVNGVSAGSVITSAGAGNMGSFPLNVGARNLTTARLNGDIFALPMIVRRLMTNDERAAAEKAFGKSIGVLQ